MKMKTKRDTHCFNCLEDSTEQVRLCAFHAAAREMLDLLRRLYDEYEIDTERPGTYRRTAQIRGSLCLEARILLAKVEGKNE